MIDYQDVMILYELVFRKQRMLPLLEKKCRLSRRQLTYSIQKLNDAFSDGKEKLIKIRGNEVRLTQESEEILQAYLVQTENFHEVYYTEKNRQPLLFLALSCFFDYLSLNHLIDFLDTSRSTVLSDLKKLKQELQREKITISYSREKGYFLVGDEAEIRARIMKTVIELLSQETGEIFLRQYVKKHLLIDYFLIEQQVLTLSHEHHLSFFDNKLKEFTFSFIFLLQRISQHLFDFYDDTFIDKTSNEFQFSQSICHVFQIANQENVHYLTAWILGLSTGNIQYPSADKVMIEQLVRQFLRKFESISGIRFSDREAIKQTLYAHFRPSFYRLFYHLPITNPLTDKIKNEYPQLFFLVNEAMQVIQSLVGQIPEEEVAFLAMHVAAFSLDVNETCEKKYHAFVLCPSGVGTSILLQKELETLFPMISFQLEKSQKQLPVEKGDLIFTTALSPHLFEVNLPFILVNPILTPTEKIELIKQVYQLLKDEIFISPPVVRLLTIVKKHVSVEQYEKIENEMVIQSRREQSNFLVEEGREEPLLSDITSENLVKLQVDAQSWEDAIRQSTEVFVRNSIALPSYIDGMIQTTKEMGPYIVITKHVAMPHARPETGAKKIGISIATLKNPVAFGNKENDPVKYIFGLCALDNQTHLTAMSELAELLDHPEFYQMLDQAKNPEEVITFIKHFEETREKDE